MGTCAVEGCDREVVGRTHCQKHRMRMHRHGSPHTVLHRHDKEPCSVAGCDRDAHFRRALQRWLCSTHMRRFERGQSLGEPVRECEYQRTTSGLWSDQR